MRRLLTLVVVTAACTLAAEWKGAISEAGCGLKHATGSAAAEKCVAGCVKKGAAPVFVSEGIQMRPDVLGVPIPIVADVTLVGTTLYFQWAVFCAGSPTGLVLSDGLAVTVSGW